MVHIGNFQISLTQNASGSHLFFLPKMWFWIEVIFKTEEFGEIGITYIKEVKYKFKLQFPIGFHITTLTYEHCSKQFTSTNAICITIVGDRLYKWGYWGRDVMKIILESCATSGWQHCFPALGTLPG